MVDFVNPSSDAYAVRGYPFFRLNTLLSSPGDIFESAQGGYALALGPQSDVANVRVAYFDDQAPGFLNQTQITPSRAFTGRIVAALDALYSPSQRPGRLLFWMDDLYLPNFFPFSYSQVNDAITRVTPRLDVIQYFKPQDGLQSERADGNFTFQNFAPLVANPGFSWLTIPYWGRKYAVVSVGNPELVNDITMAVYGVNYETNWTVQIGMTVTINPTEIGTVIVDAVTHGMFDALFIAIGDAGGGISPTDVPVIVRTSDNMP